MWGVYHPRIPGTRVTQRREHLLLLLNATALDLKVPQRRLRRRTHE